MIEEWQKGATLLGVVGLSLLGGAITGALLWAFAVVLPAELFFDAVWLEDYWLFICAVGAGTIGVHGVGRVARLNL